LTVPDSTGVVFRVHGEILQTQQYKLLSGSRCAGCGGKTLSPPTRNVGSERTSTARSFHGSRRSNN
jgi:hypothetical protein